MKTAFLDRDGVINRKRPDGEYVARWEEFEFLPRVPEALRLLQDAGWRLVVVTNQRGIALGRYSEDDLHAIHRRMAEALGKDGVGLAGVYHCPHEKGQCDCRKPLTGLFKRAARDFPDLRWSDAVVIGDSASDMEAACRLGCPGYLVTGSRPANEDLVGPIRENLRGTGSSLYEIVVNYLLPDTTPREDRNRGC